MSVLLEVATERLRQDARWGDQSGHPDPFWACILGEEQGEVCRAVLNQDPDQDLRAELIQVAAVAVAWVEALDKRGVSS